MVHHGTRPLHHTVPPPSELAHRTLPTHTHQPLPTALPPKHEQVHAIMREQPVDGDGSLTVTDAKLKELASEKGIADTSVVDQIIAELQSKNVVSSSDNDAGEEQLTFDVQPN